MLWLQLGALFSFFAWHFQVVALTSYVLTDRTVYSVTVAFVFLLFPAVAAEYSVILSQVESEFIMVKALGKRMPKTLGLLQ